MRIWIHLVCCLFKRMIADDDSTQDPLRLLLALVIALKRALAIILYVLDHVK